MKDEQVCNIPTPATTHIVEVPVYFRLAISVPAVPGRDGVAARIGRDYVDEFIVPELKQNNMHWPVGQGTVMELSVVPLCPGEDDTPDVFDAHGEVQLFP